MITTMYIKIFTLFQRFKTAVDIHKYVFKYLISQAKLPTDERGSLLLLNQHSVRRACADMRPDSINPPQ